MSPTWLALSGSVQGSVHESMGKPNQDAVAVHQEGGNLFLAIADGHGATRSFRSQRGSALAVECAMRALRNLLWRIGPDAPLSTLRHQVQDKVSHEIVAAWHRAVRADIARDPFSPLDFAAFPEKVPVIKPGEELPYAAYLAYGATMLYVAITPRFIAYAQLGDGDILLVDPEGEVSRPWPRHHEYYSNSTVSLCSHYAARDFYTRVVPRRCGYPALILVATDGYSNCFEDDTGFFTVGRDFLSYLREAGVALVQEKLEHWLHESSRDGSGDDITLALAARWQMLRRP